MVQWVWWCWLLLWFFVSFFVFFCFRFLLQGSYANGSAMRIAPVGVAFRNADHQVLYAATEAAEMCTHVHAEAVDAAFVQAAAVALLVNDDPRAATAGQLLEQLIALARTEEMRTRLCVIQNALQVRDRPCRAT